MSNVIQLGIMSAVTALLRFLPFIVFRKNKETPKYIMYLGKVLPMAIMAMLVVYCLKGITFASTAGFAPALISVAAVVILHVTKRNTLLSILGGTVLYMILINLW